MLVENNATSSHLTVGSPVTLATNNKSGTITGERNGKWVVTLSEGHTVECFSSELKPRTILHS